MGLFPPYEDRHKYIAGWALLIEKDERPRFYAGMRVYNILYGTAYGMEPHGTVVQANDVDNGQCIVVRDDRGGNTITVPAYYVSLPRKYDLNPPPQPLDDLINLIKECEGNG